MSNIANLASANKGLLRQYMRDAQLPYTGLNTDAMRAQLERYYIDVASDAAAALDADIADPEVVADDVQPIKGETDFTAAFDAHIAAMPVAELTDEDRAMLAELEATNEEVAEVVQPTVATAPEFGVKVEVAPAPSAPRSTSKGVRIQKDRPQQNGVKMPSEGSLCRAVWDEVQRSEDAATPHTVKTIKAWAEVNGTNVNNAAIEFYARRKFYGVSSRIK